MQIFLPSPDFKETAQVLDYRRLKGTINGKNI